LASACALYAKRSPLRTPQSTIAACHLSCPLQWASCRIRLSALQSGHLAARNLRSASDVNENGRRARCRTVGSIRTRYRTICKHWRHFADEEDAYVQLPPLGTARPAVGTAPYALAAGTPFGFGIAPSTQATNQCGDAEISAPVHWDIPRFAKTRFAGRVMISQKRISSSVHRTRRGSVVKVVKERYLREDIVCGASTCELCEKVPCWRAIRADLNENRRWRRLTVLFLRRLLPCYSHCCCLAQLR
jgi:hypothetical protein